MDKLIGIFAPVGESKNVILGPELIKQIGESPNWCTNPATDYWNAVDANWSADDVKITSDGNNGTLRKNNFWKIGHGYRTRLEVDWFVGILYGPCDGTNNGIVAVGTGDYVCDYFVKSLVHMYMLSDSFNGNILSLSIKEILECDE